MKGLTFAGVLVSIAVFIFPFVNSHGIFYAPMNAKAFFVFGFSAILAMIFSYQTYKGNIRLLAFGKSSVLLWSSLVLVLVHLLSGIQGVNLGASLHGDIIRGTGIILISYLFLLSYMLSSLLEKKDWMFVGKAVVGSSVAYTALYLLEVFVAPGGQTGLSAPQFLFGNSTFAGTFVLIGIVLAIVYLLGSRSKSRGRQWLFAALTLQLLHPAILNSEILLGNVGFDKLLGNPILILGDAQASSATAFLVLIFLLIRTLINRIVAIHNRRKAVRIFTGVFAGIVAVALVMLFIKGSVVQEKYAENSSSARLILWETSFDSVKERPFLGYGPENFEMAYQKNFDNRLFLKENLGEIWFDKAHNFFIDTLIEVGFLGLIAWLALFFFLARTFIRASRKGILGEAEDHMLIVLICANVLQMQTSFQTVVTYFYTFVLLGYGLYLEKEMSVPGKEWGAVQKMSIVSGILVFFIILTPIALFKQNSSQRDLVQVLKTKDNAAREEKIMGALSSEHSLVTIRVGAGSLIKGVTARLAATPLTPESRKQALKEMGLYEQAYEDYVALHPEHYRARVNLAYLYMFETIMGEERLQEAKDLLAGSGSLSPNNPLTLAMEALAFMYGGDFDTAEAKIDMAISMNPDIDFTHDVKSHIELQKTRFPKITFLSLDNL